MVAIFQPEAKLDVLQIEEIEKIVGLRFPDDYKEHLLEFNGGQCDLNIFVFDEDGKMSESSIDWFLAIYEGEYDNLRSYIEVYKVLEKRMPSNMLPIAHDPVGNLICISCDGDDFGRVYFWDHEKEVDYGKASG
ncbi:SMI1/KNR4 family protein [Parachryseolinea silvisoli]|uniref:SMI1/KNR4 family protein n=1 Tax=Parachryseolinea silvisoli TaxID=2873601 RepID=UPI002265CBDF|nr:SMI1/KNR4 family protein [Parachryseolinea silvisoli]MCD9017906.1 SMI1/KNR4 family protein [Parachryseolinea silvisoli]